MAAAIDELHLCYLNLIADVLKTKAEWYEYHMTVKRHVEMSLYVWPVKLTLSLVSFFVSLLNTIVFTRMPMQKSSLNLLLAALEVSNMTMSLSLIALSSINVQFGSMKPDFNTLLVERLSIIIPLITSSFMNWMAVVISCWRFIAVKWPFKATYRLTKKLAVVNILWVFLLCAIPCVALQATLYEHGTVNILVCSDLGSNLVVNFTRHHFDQTAWAKQHKETLLTMEHASYVLYGILPSVGLVLLTVCLLVTICTHRKSQKGLREGQTDVYAEEGQKRTTIILLVLLVACMMSNSVEMLLMLLKDFGNKQRNASFITAAYLVGAYFITQVTNSLSFFGYYFMGTNFRATFWELFKKRK